MTTEPWGKEQWDRLASGEFYDGMESWLPWLVDEEVILADLLAPRSLILLFDPKRLKDRASEIVAEEQDLAQSLATTWKALEPGGEPRTFPGLHVPFERALKSCASDVWTITHTASNPDEPSFESRPWETAAGGPDRLLDQIRDLSQRPDHRLLVAADGHGSAQRMADALRAENIDLTLNQSERYEDSPGGQIVAAPLEHGFIAPTLSLRC